MSSIQDSVRIHQAKKMSSRAAKDKRSVDAKINMRVWKMFEEAEEFLPYLGMAEQQVADLEVATADFFDTALPLLSMPLPRVWQRVEGGLAEPLHVGWATGEAAPSALRGLQSEAVVVGGVYDPERMRDASSRFDTRTQLEIRKPLAAWLRALDLVRGRMPELDQLRVDLEKRGEKVLKAEEHMERERLRSLGVSKAGGAGPVMRNSSPRSRGASRANRCAPFASCTGANSAPPADREEALGLGEAAAVEGQQEKATLQDWHMEELRMKLKDRQRKVEAVRQSFDQVEVVLYEQLSGLCRDAAWLKSYMAAELLLLKELMQEAAYWLGPTKQPLPMMLETGEPGEKALAFVSGNETQVFSMPMTLIDSSERQNLLEELSKRRFRRVEGTLRHGISSKPLEARAQQARRSSRPPTAPAGAEETPLKAASSAEGPVTPSPGGWGMSPGPYSTPLSEGAQEGVAEGQGEPVRVGRH